MRSIIFLLVVFISSCSTVQSYKKIHDKATVIDTHNDVLTSVIMDGMNIEHDLTNKAHTDIARFKKGGVDIQVFSVFCNDKFGKDTAFKHANIQIDSLYNIVGRNGDKMMMVTNPTELKQAIKQKKLGCMMGVEGGHMIEDNIGNLEALYNRGVRYLTLTWNNSTSWASSAKDETTPPANANKKGLNEFGKQVVKKMNELGMMIDVSHVGEQTFWDALSITTKPVIASHSCAYSLCPVFRNLKDDQIKAIAKNGGLISLNFYSGFIDSNYNKRQMAFLSAHKKEVDSLKKAKKAGWEIEMYLAKNYAAEASALRPPLSMLLDHIDYIVQLAGIDHVGLGSDFDGIESSPKELDDVASFPALTRALLQRGYSKKEVKKILGENFLRVFSANVKTAN